MAFIDLKSNLDGMLSLLMFDKETGNQISNFAHTLMRRESTLEVWERELIAAYVSLLNECNYCQDVHTACAATLGNSELIQNLMEKNTNQLSNKLNCLLNLARQVCYFKRDIAQAEIESAKLFGATDQEIHDTVLIAAFFTMANRYVDCLGTSYSNKENVCNDGVKLATRGYLMGK